MEKQDYIQLFDKFLLKQASPEEVQILIQWLKSEGSFQDWMDEEWDVASSGMDTDLQQKLLGQIKQKISLEMQQAPLKRNKYRTIYLWTARIASVIILLLLTGISVYRYAMEQQKMQDMIVSVEKGQKANVVLPDGSKVWVNSDSRLIYGSRFTSKERILELEGEAYFDVRKDEEHPFVVRTRFGEVTVLGTAFNINAYNDADACYTTLVYGKVNFSTPDQNTITLAPGEQAVASSRGIEKRAVDVNEYIGWAQGVYVFNNKRLGDIMKTFERWYDVHVYYEKESLRDLTYSGDLQRYGTINTFLNALELTGDIYYRINGRNILIYENE